MLLLLLLLLLLRLVIVPTLRRRRAPGPAVLHHLRWPVGEARGHG